MTAYDPPSLGDELVILLCKVGAVGMLSLVLVTTIDIQQNFTWYDEPPLTAQLGLAGAVIALIRLRRSWGRMSTLNVAVLWMCTLLGSVAAATAAFKLGLPLFFVVAVFIGGGPYYTP